MRKITFLSVLLLLLGWSNAWGQTLVSNVAEQLANGTIVALQCRDTNGGPNWYFNGKAVKTEGLSYSNLFKIRSNEDGTFALQSMMDGTYIGKDGNNLAIKATKAEAAPFTAAITTAGWGNTKVSGTDNAYTVRFTITTTTTNEAGETTTSETYLNTQAQNSIPIYFTGTGGYSVWYVYTFTAAEAKAMQPYVCFTSPRGGYLSANGESGNLQHINNETETSFWKIELNGEGDGVKLHNVSSALQNKALDSKDGFSETGVAWYILDNPHNSGYKCISLTTNLTTNNCLDASNSNSGIGYWKPGENDYEGTSWLMETSMSMERFTITYHIKDANGNVINTQTHRVLRDNSFPAVQYGVSGSDFYDTSAIPESTVTADGAYDVTINPLPFKVSTITPENGFDNYTQWHMLTIRGSKHLAYDIATGEVKGNSNSSTEPDANNVFAFTGDPFHGFKIYNGAAGEDVRLYVSNTNNQHCTFTAEGATFGLYHNTNNGYQFKLVGSNTTHLNDVQQAGILGVWTDSGSAADGGSTFIFSDAVDMPVYTVTYHIKEADGDVINTQTHHVVKGAQFPGVRGAVSGPDLFEIPEGTVTADGEYDVAIKELPFEVTELVNGNFADDTPWYTLTVGGSRQPAYNATTGKVDNSTTPASGANANNVFAFTGDLFHGFRIYNAAAGADKSLHAANTNNQHCTFTAAGASFGLYKNGTAGYQFKLVGENRAYLNDAGGDAEVNQLRVWTDILSATSDGSTFTFTEASPEVCTITYHVKYNASDDEDLSTQNYKTVIGAPFPAVYPGASASNFFDTGNIPTTPVTADMAGAYTVTVKDLPFQISTIGERFDSKTKWYTLKIRGNKHLVYNAATGKVSNNTTEPSENDANNVFAFTGDPFHGFKIYNGVAGADKRLYVTDTNNEQCTFTAEGATFGLYKNGTTGYQFKLVGSNTTHLNDISDHLGVWTAASSATDGGSTFVFTGGPLELPVYTVTYNFKNSEGQSAGLESQTQYVVKGAPYAVRAASGSEFFTIKDIPEGGRVLGGGTYTVTVGALPFSTSTIGEHFDSATKWHTLTVRSKYPSYNALSGEIDITTESAEVNANNVFAFTGNLIDGFKIYNAAAGSGKKLYVTDVNNDRCTFTEDGAVFGLYTHGEKYQFKLSDTGLYLYDVTANGVLSVKNTTDAGSEFTFTKVSFDATGAVAIAKKNLKTIIAGLEAQLGTDPGYYPDTQDNRDKINVAKDVLEESTSADEEGVNDQIAILNEILQAGCIMPEAGKFYQIISAYPGFETHESGNNQKKAMYSDGAHVKWGTLVEEPENGTLAGDDRKQIWTIEPKEDGTGYVMRNYADGKYPNGISTRDQAFPVETVEALTVLDYLDVLGQFNVKISGYPAHAGGHGNGAGVTGDIVNYSGGADGCSAWYIHEVKEPTQRIIHDVVYNYTVDGETKRTFKLVYDEADPAALPFTSDFVTIGEFTLDEENKTVTVPCTYHDIPFTYSDSYTHATWYAIDMHSNQAAYTWTYVADDDKNVQLPVTSNYDLQGGCMPAERRWAFVGDPLNGFKIYNQAAGSGMTLRKPANGDVVSGMSDINDRNRFFLHNANIAHSFALRLDEESDGHYLNHNTSDGINVLRGYTNADQGSSCRVFEVDPASDIRKQAFYRIKGGSSGKYVSAGTTGSMIPMVEDNTGAETIYYLDAERKLLNYSNGLYIYHTYSTGNIGEANTWGITTNGDKLMFVADPIGDSRYMYDGGTTINRNSSDNATHCRWTVEPVTELPVTVSGAARWGTFCAPVSLRIPDGVEAYYASGTDAEENYIYMTKLSGNIPAGLPVLISNVNDTDVDGDKTYQFHILTGEVAAVSDQNPQWLGTFAKISVPSNTTYMLSLKDNKVAFRKNATEVVRGFKAYLQPVDTQAASLSIRFDEFATDIQRVKAWDTEKTEFYDLSGRRVYFPTRGIYVTNRGEKVFIK